MRAVTFVSDLDAMATAIAAWLVTFTVHGIIACLTALLSGRFLLKRAASRDLLWRGALVLPIVTSFMSLSVLTLPLADFVRRASPVAVEAPQVVVTVTRQGPHEQRSRRVRDAAGTSLAVLVLAMALTNAAVGSARYRGRRRDLKRELHGTWPTAIAPRVWAKLTAPVPRVRLLAGPHLLSPLALGRSTVCVPAVSFATLNETQQAGVLAHEVAHLKRHDPYWIGFAEWLAAVSPFGFVLRVVVSQMRRDSELLCDAAAARALRSSVSLVEALSVFVKDLEAARRIPLRVGYADSRVLERARRLLYGPPETARPDQWAWVVLLGIGMLAAIAPRATLRSSMGPPGATDTVTREVHRAENQVERWRVVRLAAGCVYRRASAEADHGPRMLLAGTGRPDAARCGGVRRRGVPRIAMVGRGTADAPAHSIRNHRSRPVGQWSHRPNDGLVRSGSGRFALQRGLVGTVSPGPRRQTARYSRQSIAVQCDRARDPRERCERSRRGWRADDYRRTGPELGREGRARHTAVMSER
jgi:beta-lactamase regulating signal transducer with metallopeptidase domain